MNTFQYKIEKDLSENELNFLGKQGWELIAVTTQLWEDPKKGYREEEVIFYFKKYE